MVITKYVNYLIGTMSYNLVFLEIEFLKFETRRCSLLGKGYRLSLASTWKSIRPSVSLFPLVLPFIYLSCWLWLKDSLFFFLSTFSCHNFSPTFFSLLYVRFFFFSFLCFLFFQQYVSIQILLMSAIPHKYVFILWSYDALKKEKK